MSEAPAPASHELCFALVVRHASAGVPAQVARWSSAAVINAGDGWHEHPTQALLDCYTIRQRLGSLAGRSVAIIGASGAVCHPFQGGIPLLTYQGPRPHFAELGPWLRSEAPPERTVHSTFKA